MPACTVIDADSSQRQISGPTKRYFPFLNAPVRDVTTIFYERTYEVDRVNYTPFAAGTTLPAETSDDPADGSAQILQELIQQVREDGVQTVKCLFGYVPIDQVRYSNQSIPKPTAVAGGGTTDSTMAVYSDSTVTVSTLVPFTLLSGYMFFFVGAVGKVYGARQASTSANNGADTRVSCTGHGIVAGDTCGDAPGARGIFTVVDANTIDLLGVNWAARVTFIAKYYRDYTPGTDDCRTRLTQKFYIDSSTIPKATTKLTDAQFLAAVLSTPAGLVDYSTDSGSPWNGTSLSAKTLTAIQMADL